MLVQIFTAWVSLGQVRSGYFRLDQVITD